MKTMKNISLSKKITKVIATALFFVFIMQNHCIQAKNISNKPIILKNDIWTIEVIPETFSIACKPVNKSKFELSTGQSDLGDVRLISYKNNILSWEFVNKEIKEKYVLFQYKPEFKLPLNGIVFHDSFVSTNHNESAFYKFKNVQKEVELISLLYMAPPLYHLNIEEFEKKKELIKRFYSFFSPIHKKVGFEQLTDFHWLSRNRLVQKTKFGNSLEIVANFDSKDFTYNNQIVPPDHVVAFWLDTDQISKYSY